jgi:hypothetical protein
MKKSLLILPLVLMLLCSLAAQIITKPIGCYAGTNGTNPIVLAHPEARGVLLIEKWTDIEPTPGNFDFAALDNKIATVTNANLKFSLAISGGAFGSPKWLMESQQAKYFDFMYQNQNWKLPLWWDPIVEERLNILIEELGKRYANHPSLSHVYVTQMTSNGVEGHLNGISMVDFAAAGYTSQKWITAAVSTANAFAAAFADLPIVFEIHELDKDIAVPSAIIDALYADTNLCKRVGLGMWWISGKTTYQPNLINYIANFQGDKYAQVIGRSDELSRFKDDLYASVFEQAKELGIRYIEPWPYEMQNHTYDDLLKDFNAWADAKFNPTDTCGTIPNTLESQGIIKTRVKIFLNPVIDELSLLIEMPYKNLEVSIVDVAGKRLLTTHNQTTIHIGHLPASAYFVLINCDGAMEIKKIIKK